MNGDDKFKAKPRVGPGGGHEERTRKTSSRNPGDLDDFVGLESRLSVTEKERDDLRQLVAALNKENQDLRARLAAVEARGAPSAEAIQEYKAARKGMRDERPRVGSGAQPSLAYYHHGVRAQVLEHEIASRVAGEQEELRWTA